MNEFVEQFLIEGRELVAQGNDDLLALESQPNDKERLHGAFRAFHTLKGAAGIVDFAAMVRALHAAEDVLSAVRSGTAPVTAALIDVCLASLEQVSTWLDLMQASGEIPADADVRADDLVSRFSGLRMSGVEPTTVTAELKKPAGLSQIGQQLLEAQKILLAEPVTESAASRLESVGRIAANVLRHHGLDATDLEGPLQSSLLAGDPGAMSAGIDRILASLVEQPPAPAGSFAAPSPDVTLRVDVDRVDRLVRLTGELLIAKNAVGHSAQLARETADIRQLAVTLKNQHLQLDRLIGQLQQAVFSLRVLPLHHAFQRFPRLVREMAAASGKPARLIVQGATTEADKTIVEAITEPLLHVLRNGLDHGVESHSDRLACGKPEIATISLRASRRGDRVIIEVEDDGRGIDVVRVREVALRRNTISEQALNTMSDEEAIDLIFAPGFSTAAEVTALSGRGVGMDVVRTTVERLGGQVTLASTAGKGTTVRFSLPFTVMMTTVLTVEASGQVFGVPIEAVVETIKVARNSISAVGAARAVVVRNRTLPLVDLSQALGGEGRRRTDEASVLVVRVGGHLGGLEVDRLGDRIDVMLKAPEGLLAGVPGIDGTTLMGDGRVLIVLDLQAVFDNESTAKKVPG